MEKDLYVIILAAGKGQRMASLNENYSKVAYPILGKPLVNYVLDAAKPLGAKETFVVVGFGGEETIKCVGNQAKIVWQREVLGTGHAVMQVSEYLKNKEGKTIILCGDTPLLTTETIQRVLKKHERNGNALTICSTVLSNPAGYGRVIREKSSYRVLEVNNKQFCAIYTMFRTISQFRRHTNSLGRGFTCNIFDLLCLNTRISQVYNKIQ